MKIANIYQKIIIVSLTFILIALFSQLYRQSSYELLDYKNASKEIEQRAEDLLSRMTLKEKINQMQHNNFGEIESSNSVKLNSILVAGTHTLQTKSRLQKFAVEESRFCIPF